jgi:hypothetical protein
VKEHPLKKKRKEEMNEKVIEIEYLYIIRSSVLSLLSFLSINIEQKKRKKKKMPMLKRKRIKIE